MRTRRRGFTLIEVLVVVAIVAVLVAILLPSLRGRRCARGWSRCTRICGRSPSRWTPMRSSTTTSTRRRGNRAARLCCTSCRWNWRPRTTCPKVRTISSGHTSRTRSVAGRPTAIAPPGAVWQNGIFMDFPDITWRPRAQLWVPDDIPRCQSALGRYYADCTNEAKSPVAYAVWSMGPGLDSTKLPRWEDGSIDESRFPLPRRFWLTSDGRPAGLITHFRTRTGLTYMSP